MPLAPAVSRSVLWRSWATVGERLYYVQAREALCSSLAAGLPAAFFAVSSLLKRPASRLGACLISPRCLTYTTRLRVRVQPSRRRCSEVRVPAQHGGRYASPTLRSLLWLMCAVLCRREGFS